MLYYLYIEIMPPKQKSTTEQLKLEHHQLRRSFNSIYNETSTLFDRQLQSKEDIARPTSSLVALTNQFKECSDLEKQVQELVIEKINDEGELDSFFDEVTEVTSQQRGKLTKLEFIISKYNAYPSTPSSTRQEPPSSTSFSRSKRPDLNLPTFSGNITEWFGFWERFQSQVGNSPDLPKAAKFMYLIGQLKGEALTTVKGLTPSHLNYDILVTTLQENFGLLRRIIRAHVMNILKLPKPTSSASSVRHFYNTVMGDICSLKALNIDVSACAPIIVPILEEKLPGKILSSIVDCRKYADFDLDEFTENFKNYIIRQEQAHSSKSPAVQDTQPSFSYEMHQPPSMVSTMIASSTNCCQLCKDSHATQRCPISASEKQSIVLMTKLCLNCLRSGHRVSNCSARGRCAKCNRKHHNAIHGIQIHRNTNHTSRQSDSALPPPAQSKPTEQSSHSAMPSTSSPQATSNCAATFPRSSESFGDINANNHTHETILLKTAKAVALSIEKKLTAQIFFDEGSQRCYIRTTFASALNVVPTSYETLSVCSFGGSVTEKSYGVTKIGLETPTGVEYVSLLVTDEIIQPVNQQYYLDLKAVPRLYDLHLANDYSDTSFVIDILLGADVAFRFLGSISNVQSKPIVLESKFRYVLSGPLPGSSESGKDSSISTHEMSTPTTDLPSTEAHTSSVDCDISFHNLLSNSSLFSQVERFFQNQFVSEPTPVPQSNEFLYSYQEQIEFRDGSYYAPLPWKTEHPSLPSTLPLCKQRLAQVTSRLHKLGLMQAYCNVMAEHLAHEYIEEVQDLPYPRPEENCHYLPHFFVLKDSETTPLRIVFAANSGHVSLNDCLYTGPCLLNNLMELLIHFCFPTYAFIANIQRAFLNIKLKEEDHSYVRFLWYKDNNPSKEICVYTYTTVVFGHTSSPMTLGAVLLKHLQRYNHPVAVDLSQKLYVDNLLSGIQREAEALLYFEKACKIMREGHFIVRQWYTNSATLQEFICTHKAGGKSEIVSLLGLLWDASTDAISFPEQQFNSTLNSLSKRKVLSIASQLFDPLGLVLPVTVAARLFIAELWEEKPGWDQPLPTSKINVWKNIENDLNATSRFRFLRWIDFSSDMPVYIHVFTDASKLVIGAVAYLSQGAKSILLGSKSKLAPRNKQSITIPQLELSAMLLGAQFCAGTLAILNKDFQDVHVRLWTDSEIALFWLSSTRRLKQFVQNKVDSSSKLFDSKFWSHTPSQENPADLVSCGCSAQVLQQSDLWSCGPTWIPEASLWPQWPKSQPMQSTILTAVVAEKVLPMPSRISKVIDLSRFNHYSCLLATSVYVHRFCYRTGNKGPPSTAELELIETEWIHTIQEEHYLQVIDYFTSTTKGTAPPIVRQHNLFLDDKGLIRTKGRFDVALSLLLLPQHSRFSQLLVLDFHQHLHHIGVGGTIVALRQRFWIPSVCLLTWRMLRTCITCKKVTGSSYLLPSPAELPKFRLDTVSPPLSNIGVDFRGHFLGKDQCGNHIKIYICLFTCLKTRAISLELDEDLSPSSFLQAFRRHCSVYSTPRFVLSDNAQTFKCAEKDLQTLFALFDKDAVQQVFAHKRIEFRYIPA